MGEPMAERREKVKQNDLKQFTVQMMGLSELYNREVSEALLELYFDALTFPFPFPFPYPYPIPKGPPLRNPPRGVQPWL